FAVGPRPLWEVLAERPLVAHNAAFDLGMLRPLGFEPGPVTCTLVLSQLVHGTRHPRGFHELQACVQRELGQELDKELQRSDWLGVLTREQLDYAARDAEVLRPLHEALAARVAEGGQQAVAALESRCLPAVAWMAAAGVALDAGAWRAVAADAEGEAGRLARE